MQNAVSQTSTTTEEPEPEGVEIAEPLRKPERQLLVCA